MATAASTNGDAIETIGAQKTSLTILTCQGTGKKATKQFSLQEDGTIEKRSFSAVTFFTYEEKSVSSLEELTGVLEELLDESKKCVIKAAPKQQTNGRVQRKIYGPDAAFDPCPRSYVMLDIDKQACPEYFDAIKRPEEIVAWARETLPAPFTKASCYYQFSSSQNVPKKMGEPLPSKVSIHLWFWCDRAVSDTEWKTFFKANPSQVDHALFSPAQIHYTARPIFVGIDDPLPTRSGVLKGQRDVVSVPEIEAPEKTKFAQRPMIEPEVNQDSREQAINLLLPSYKEGTRDRLVGAIAATLYRGGWAAENAAHFSFELADRASDPSAAARYDSALRICDSVDNDRPAQGIPTLRDELGVENLDEILTLLGVGEPDIKEAITKLLGITDLPEIKKVVKMLTSLSPAEQKDFISQIQTVTKLPKAILNTLLHDCERETFSFVDWPDYMVECFLEGSFEGGRHLLIGHGGGYWHYNGKHWESASLAFLKNRMLGYARQTVQVSDGENISSLLNASMNILEGRVFRDNDPLGLVNSNPPTVINCQNGEVWFDHDGEAVLKPHRSESYLRHCLDVKYDPTATSPLFDNAVLEIFAKNEKPDEMFRHFMELAGYICQPWRKHAIIVLLYGGGNNGKTSLVNIILRILGQKTVMCARMSDIENSPFKLGSLDGKLMLLDDDVDEGTCIPDGFLKKISEEKIMTGEHKYKPPFEFICRAVPVMLANAYPAIKDLTEGIRRRVMVIPFSRKFERHEAKPGLFDTIWEEEASGILNHIVAGFERLKKRGAFDEPSDCIAARQEWLIKSNPFPTFIDECCEIGIGLKQSIRDLCTIYKDYCSETGVRGVLTRPGLEKRLASLGYGIKRVNGENWVKGIKASVSPFSNRGTSDTSQEKENETRKPEIKI